MTDLMLSCLLDGGACIALGAMAIGAAARALQAWAEAPKGDGGVGMTPQANTNTTESAESAESETKR